MLVIGKTYKLHLHWLFGSTRRDADGLLRPNALFSKFYRIDVSCLPAGIALDSIVSIWILLFPMD